MNVLILCPAVYNTSPGQRFRIEQWIPYLEKQGVRFTYLPFEDEELHDVIYKRGNSFAKAYFILKALYRRIKVCLSVRQYDLVYIFRELALLGPAFIEHLIARMKVKIIFDFDDAIWLSYLSPANKYFSYLKCFGKTATICRISRHVMVGNEYLASYARRYNSHVSIVPTTIETRDYQIRSYPPQAQEHPVIIGWTGSYSTVQHLDTIRSALAKLQMRCRFRLMVVGTPTYQLDGVDILAKSWKADSEISDLQMFDIGLMPLPNDQWSRGKCGLKLLQCMGVGVPVVASPVGVNKEIIKEGVNGFMATTDEEWVEKLTRLIENVEMRRGMGQQGRHFVQQHYSAEIWAPRVLSIFNMVVGESRSLRSNPDSKESGCI